MRYANRREAGRLLANALDEFQGRDDVVVLALPRGGVPVAFEVAEFLGVPLDVLIVRKLGVPTQPELALGALASGDVVVVNSEIMSLIPDADSALQSALAKESPELMRRESAYRKTAPAVQVENKRVLLVDDGVATGATMAAGVESLKRRGAAEVIVAVPVGSREAVERLRTEADDVICLRMPLFFNAVGEWYENFDQTEDSEVCALLTEAARAPRKPTSLPR